VPGGAFSATETGHCFDQLSTIAFLAGVTEKLRLVTSVMVVPHRPVMLTAKMLATIDVLCEGRLTLGVGAGWMPEEFKLLGAEFADRGRLTDEYIAAFKELWTSENPQFSGKHVNFSGVVFNPRPLQKPHPPIWVGGESAPALRRAVRFGDAWYPGNNSQLRPLDTPSRFATGIAEVRKLCEQAGRDPTSLDLAMLVQNFYEFTPHKINDGSARRMFTGSPDDMLEDAAALEAVGLRHVALRLGGTSVNEAVERIERFGRDVIARYKS
jgi:probable F420-dependent oxidoreductase